MSRNKGIEPIEPRSDNVADPAEPGNEYLSLKQLSFVNHLLSPACMLNPVTATKLAGYKCSTDKSARLQAERNMLHPLIRAEIETRMAKISLQSSLSAEAVLNKLWEEGNNHTPEDSSPSARVQALNTLARFYKMIGPGKKDQEPEEQQSSVNIHIHTGEGPVIIEGEKVNEPNSTG